MTVSGRAFRGRARRRTDYEFLTSLQARELLQREGIVVIDYKTIQQAWPQTEAPQQAEAE